ncbi:toll/interleukin-1 receptor domain-containing protein [Evansella tamaricis]|uniref:Toll/interleukin-1 receptor domain-containing protein n=1 Tax=Evansella tamaricis TaxID=2069301 RepID=A0ABS6JDH4_9BACI|nr:toll/interleukin-1 receptor domain-containing protein [Evansella tamaricis]MBU9711528.1 toll/interleukin-1 receptor domain-containing protein [Evansella tamaricis]
MKRFFMNYVERDQQIADRLANDLELNGIRIVDEEMTPKMPTEENYFLQEQRVEESRHCDYLIIVLSEESVQSSFLKKLVAAFDSRVTDNRIIAILLEDVDISVNLLVNMVVFDFRDDYSSSFSKLKDYLLKEMVLPNRKRNKQSLFLPSSYQRAFAFEKGEVAVEVFGDASNFKTLPDFTDTGYLPPGVHTAEIKNILDRFASGPFRGKFRDVIRNIVNFSKRRRGSSLLFGGAFVSSFEQPVEINIVIVFKEAKDIPGRLRKLVIENTPIHLYYSSLDEPATIMNHLHSFSQTLHGDYTGIVKLELNGEIGNEKEEVKGFTGFQSGSTAPLKNSESGGSAPSTIEPQGMLVTMHGILTNAEWNTEIAPIASSQGWIFAPYVYRNNWIDLLFLSKRRRRIINHFRNWIFDMQMRYRDIPISIIAHSFGTFIIASYLTGFGSNIPVRFQSIILTGSIINRNFDWEKQYDEGKVIRVRNEVAANDSWVQRMPVGLLRLDPLFGRSGVNGFDQETAVLTQTATTIFNHHNVIRRDVVEQHWLPYLNANANLKW